MRTVLRSDVGAGDTQLPVQTAAGFAANMRVYINNGSNTSGEVVTLTGADSGTNTLFKSSILSQGYLAGSGVYAVDERAYAVDTSDSNNPVLTVGINGKTPVPFAFGIENLQLQYQLARNCETVCEVVDIPATEADYALVNQIFITLTARSLRPGSNGQYYRITRTVSAKPRNLLPG